MYRQNIVQYGILHMQCKLSSYSCAQLHLNVAHDQCRFRQVHGHESSAWSKVKPCLLPTADLNHYDNAQPVQNSYCNGLNFAIIWWHRLCNTSI